MGDAAGRDQFVHRLDRVRQRVVAAPVQQVQVDALQPQPRQAALAGLARAAAAGVVRVDLADDEEVFALHIARAQRLGHGLADHGLGTALAVHLGRVDQAVAQADGLAHRGHLGRAAGGVFAHAPGAETENRHLAAGGEWKCSHGHDGTQALWAGARVRVFRPRRLLIFRSSSQFDDHQLLIFHRVLAFWPSLFVNARWVPTPIARAPPAPRIF
ncbi:hypothetical protein D3C72_1220400 [compost metagenome]